MTSENSNQIRRPKLLLLVAVIAGLAVLGWVILKPDKTETSMNTDSKKMLSPTLDQYLRTSAKESDLIAPERKQELVQVAKYVEVQHKQGLSAKLTFVCTHNSRRSQFSQVWAKVAADWQGIGQVETFSGGTEATAFNPRAVAALRRAGLSVTTSDETAANPHYEVRVSESPESDSAKSQVCFSKVFDSAPNPARQFCAVMTCAHADEICPVVTGSDLRVSIRYDDPKVADDTDQEAVKYDERCKQICRDMMYLFSLVGKD